MTGKGTTFSRAAIQITQEQASAAAVGFSPLRQHAWLQSGGSDPLKYVQEGEYSEHNEGECSAGSNTSIPGADRETADSLIARSVAKTSFARVTPKRKNNKLS
jgi:hypothetical protein